MCVRAYVHVCVCVCLCVCVCGLFLQYSLKWIFLLKLDPWLNWWYCRAAPALALCMGSLLKRPGALQILNFWALLKLFYYLFIKFKTVRRASLRNLQCISIILQILDMACPPMCRCKFRCLFYTASKSYLYLICAKLVSAGRPTDTHWPSD